LVPTGTLFTHKATSKYYLSLGSLAREILLAWQVELMPKKIGGKYGYLLGGGRITHTEPKYFAMLDLTEFSVLPSAPVSPLELFLTNKKNCPAATVW
jgi:hypothetical protein